jgi:hypothetical protein
VRRKLLASLCDDAFGNVYGSTDSEHFFALFIDSLLGNDETDPALRMAQALARAISRALDLVRSAGAGSDSYLNVAISDGEHAVVSRFTDEVGGTPESLYYFSGQLYPDVGPKAKRKGTQAVIVSSERLTSDVGWVEVPPGQIIILRRDRVPQFVDARTARPLAPPAGARGAGPATVPNSSPIAAVAAIASALQNVTRIAARITGAPPARAATPPSTARNRSVVAGTATSTVSTETSVATASGSAAPHAKAAAEAAAA